MTNRRRQLDPMTAARLKRDARCPDCSSSVRLVHNDLGPGVHRLEVKHDDTCPTLRALQQAGRARGQIALVRTTGQSAADFATEAVRAADALAAETGAPVGLTLDPYATQANLVRQPRGTRGRSRGRGRR